MPRSVKRSTRFMQAATRQEGTFAVAVHCVVFCVVIIRAVRTRR